MDINVFFVSLRSFHGKLFAIRQLYTGFFEERATDHIDTVGRINRVESHGTENVPGRHFSTVVVSGISGERVVIEIGQDMGYILLGFPGLTGIVVQIGDVVAGFVTVSILSYETRGITV